MHVPFVLERIAELRFSKHTPTRHDPLMSRQPHIRPIKANTRTNDGAPLRIVGPHPPRPQNVADKRNIGPSADERVSSSHHDTDARTYYTRRLASCGIPIDDIAYLMETDEATIVKVITDDRLVLCYNRVLK